MKVGSSSTKRKTLSLYKFDKVSHTDFTVSQSSNFGKIPRITGLLRRGGDWQVSLPCCVSCCIESLRASSTARRIRQCKSRVGGVSRTGGSKGLAVCQVVLERSQVFFNPFTRSYFRFFLSLSTFWNFPHLLKAKPTHENYHERSSSTWR